MNNIKPIDSPYCDRYLEKELFKDLLRINKPIKGKPMKCYKCNGIKTLRKLEDENYICNSCYWKEKEEE